jgi:hypothetical protein
MVGDLRVSKLGSPMSPSSGLEGLYWFLSSTSKRRRAQQQHLAYRNGNFSNLLIWRYVDWFRYPFHQQKWNETERYECLTDRWNSQQ